MMRDRAVLLVSCRDQRGIVAEVAKFICVHGGNIVHADQHSDVENGTFLQRVEWELDGFLLGRDEIGTAFAPIAARFGMSVDLRFSDRPARIAILVSKQPHCLYDLLARQRMGELEATVPLVVSNHEDAAPIARDYGIDYLHLPVAPGRHADIEPRLIAALAERQIDLVVLARYMQVLGPEVVRAHPYRIINIHHSFLPAFAGARPYHQAYARGVKVIGASAHYVTAKLDEGPIIEQDVVRVSHRNSVEDLVRKGRDLEKVVLARAVSLHLQHRVIVYGNRTAVFD